MNITGIHLYSVADVTFGPGDTQVKHLELALTDPKPTDSYIIKAATGLDAEEILSIFYNSSGSGRFNKLKPGRRTISMLIRLNPQYHLGESYESLRANLYRMISYNFNANIELRFMNENVPQAKIVGLVTKFEASIFASSPEVQITFECRESFLRGLELVSIFSDDDGLSLTNPSFIDDISTAPHGCFVSLDFLTGADYVKIESIEVTPGYPAFASFQINQPYSVGDNILFISDDGEKLIQYDDYSLSISTKIADKIQSGSVWPIVFPGENNWEITYGYNNIGSASKLMIAYKTAFWGI